MHPPLRLTAPQLPAARGLPPVRPGRGRSTTPQTPISSAGKGPTASWGPHTAPLQVAHNTSDSPGFRPEWPQLRLCTPGPGFFTFLYSSVGHAPRL
ncbi:hypothetical protein NDU88_003183 [Pleurodeles waltl]|uniref:Uncharacterized protein n=1 Tax=Pleurodeles waltl TaxID=8319 RepID=A0AAV7UBQ6_PLEWA|nr:hypothetical protein NDU88_003183 [Pleurodeles waltl]